MKRNLILSKLKTKIIFLIAMISFIAVPVSSVLGLDACYNPERDVYYIGYSDAFCREKNGERIEYVGQESPGLCKGTDGRVIFGKSWSLQRARSRCEELGGQFVKRN